LTERENKLRAVRFECPEYIPMRFVMSTYCWEFYPQDELKGLFADHPLLFPDFDKDKEVEVRYSGQELAGQDHVDDWGCVWRTAQNGIVGAVVEHPLSDWDRFASYTCPDPLQMVDWEHIARVFTGSKAAGRLAPGSLGHGHTFLKYCDLRGYENAIFDLMDEDPRALKLLGMIEDHNMTIVEKHMQIDDVEWMGYPEDLGMQKGPMISPELFRKYIKPSYERLMKPAKESGCIVHMHSDGDLHDLIDDLVDSGVAVINLQDLVNGIDWIRDRFAGKVCIEIDIDRQEVTRFGSPSDIDALIREEVEKLGSKRGGLMMLYGLYHGLPLENVKAVMDAMERYSGYYA
jgi:uroporphyrinogen decarboxylase